MIVTLTANPSVDRTMQLDAPIVRGDVFRAVSVGDEAGGKGVNVARAVAHAGVPAVAVLPADDDDLLVKGLADAGVLPGQRADRSTVARQHHGDRARRHDDEVQRPRSRVQRAACSPRSQAGCSSARSAGDWVVLSGSLPPGAPVDWYADLTAQLKRAGRRVAVDTSGAPLVATVAGDDHLPDLLKPNAEELASLTGEDEAIASRPTRAPRSPWPPALVADGIGSVLLTLGAAGAALVTAEGAWLATPPPITAAEHGRRRRRQPGRLPARRPPGPRCARDDSGRRSPTARPRHRSLGRRCHARATSTATASRSPPSHPLAPPGASARPPPHPLRR